MSTSPLKIVQLMEEALARAETDMTPYFHDDFIWDGNRGCGVKAGVKDFFEHWQRPFREAFSDRTYHTEVWMEDGNMVACYGACHATHSGVFLGIEPTGLAVKIPYIDFWRIEDGKIAYNKVSVDFAEVAAQLGKDVFEGLSWDDRDLGKAHSQL